MLSREDSLLILKDQHVPENVILHCLAVEKHCLEFGKKLKKQGIRINLELLSRGALLHAIAHIEFNAINLALDAAYRFNEMPAKYYLNWLRIADDEVRHFKLLEKRLADYGMQYGELPAHRGLWDMAE